MDFSIKPHSGFQVLRRVQVRMKWVWHGDTGIFVVMETSSVLTLSILHPGCDFVIQFYKI